MNNKFISVLCQFAVVSFAYEKCDEIRENFKIVCNTRVLESGFHRNLEIQIQMSSQSNVLIKQTLPSSLYIDPYELEKESNLNIFLPRNVDVEAMNEQSSKSEFYIYTKFDSTNWTLSVPIHVRYHAPTASSHALFELNGPELYIKVPFEAVKLRCESNNRTFCNFCQIQSNSSHLILEIAVGQIKHEFLISAVTIIVILIGFLYLMLILMRKNRKKLD